MTDKLVKGIIGISILLILGYGVWGALEIIGMIINSGFKVLVDINYSVYETFGESLLSGIFKHFITYKIVGLIFSTGLVGSSFYLSKLIGKISYVLVGVAVVILLNFITILLV